MEARAPNNKCGWEWKQREHFHCPATVRKNKVINTPVENKIWRILKNTKSELWSTFTPRIVYPTKTRSQVILYLNVLYVVFTIATRRQGSWCPSTEEWKRCRRTGGSVVENPPRDGGVVSGPSLGCIYAEEGLKLWLPQLLVCASDWEPQLLKPAQPYWSVLCNKRPAMRRLPNNKQAFSHNQKKAWAATEPQYSQIQNYFSKDVVCVWTWRVCMNGLEKDMVLFRATKKLNKWLL